MRYPVASPNFDGNEDKYVNECLESTLISSTGPFVARFEEAFAEYVGTKYAVACSNGTTALTLALLSIGVGPGDEVIVPEFTMVATAWAVTYTGAKPVFVDCGPDLNIDVNKIEERINSKTKAIIPVHVYGRPARVDHIKRIVKGRNIYVIEDAAEAHGATQNGETVGSLGDLGCFSMYGNKIITSGEGGVITTNDPELRDRIKYLRSMAFEPNHTFLHKEVGYNFRMTALQAAVALGQLERLPEFLKKRQQITEWYDEHLKQFTIPRPEGSVTWMYDVVVEPKHRDQLMADLAQYGIETRYFFKPMSMQPMYDKPFGRLMAYAFSEAGFYLPAYTDLTKSDVNYICRKFLELLPNAN